MTNLWTISNVMPDTVDSLKVLCGKSHGVFSKILEPGGATYQVSCSLPSAPSGQTMASFTQQVAPTVIPPIAPPLPVGRVIAIDDRALDALARVAQSEVGHFGKYGADQLAGGLAAVVDTVINRVAHKRYPDTIEAVIDQPKQFSAVNGPGTWGGLPPARANIAEIVRDHLTGRVSGIASRIKGATHFLNPYLSSPSAMASWGRHVVENAVAVYGDDGKKDVHYHGFPPGGTMPDPYSLTFIGASAGFDGGGTSSAGLPGADTLRDNIVRICREEQTFFRDGGAVETDDPHYKRVGEYWRSIGHSFTGKDTDQAWSAAFVSFVLDRAGAGARFPGAQAHCIYFQHFVNTTDHYPLYEALPQTDAVPDVGDILHSGREGAKDYDFAKAARVFAADHWYPSHCDIVVERHPDKLIAIGGNFNDSVAEKTIPIDADGKLIDRVQGEKHHPWIGVLKLRG